MDAKLPRQMPPPQSHEFGCFLNDKSVRTEACEDFEQPWPEHGVLVTHARKLFAQVRRDIAIAQSATSRPIFAEQPFATLAETIVRANDRVYSLAASVWNGNTDKALTVARRLKASTFRVDTPLPGGSDGLLTGSRSPVGRESGMVGVTENNQIKSPQIEVPNRNPWIN